MFWFPLLPSIPLVIYKQLSSPVIVTAIFTLLQFATLPGWKWESQPVALYLQLAEHQAPLQHHGPILRLLVAMEAAQHSTLTDREMLGDYLSFNRDIPMLSCKLTPCTISFWLSAHISFALWKPWGLWLLLPMRMCRKKRFCTSGFIFLWASLFHILGCFVCSTKFLCMLCHVLSCFAAGVKRRKRWEKWIASCYLELSWQSPKSPPAWRAVNPGGRLVHSWPWEAASAQMPQSSRAGQPKHMLMHRHSDKAVFSPLQRSYLERGEIGCTLILQ